MTLSEQNLISSRPTANVYKIDNLAVKVFTETHPTSEVLNEALNTARVEETGVNIPKIVEIAKIEGKWAISTDFIEGKTFSALIEENPEKEKEYIDTMVDLQIEITEKRCPLLNRMKEKYTRQIQSVTELDESVRFELLTRLESMPKHIKLCHGDFYPSNIIAGNDGKIYILDWVHATQGNASADAARTYLLLALKSMKTANLYLDSFCQKTNTKRQYVQKWLPIVAAVQLSKNRTEGRELLMKWLDVAEYQ